MFDISKYLEKFKKLSEGRDFLQNSVAESIREICKIDIDPKKIVVKSGIARVNERPLFKTEIFLKKPKIMENLKLKTDKIYDII